MRPDDVAGKPFYRREAENYRLLRHLGEVNLHRPMPVRLIALLPLAVVGAFVLALSHLQVRKQFDSQATATSQGNDQVRMILTAEAFPYFEKGDVIDISARHTKATVSASVISKARIQCTAQLPPSTAEPPWCTALEVRLPSNPQAATTAGLLTGVNQVRSVPRRYISPAGRNR